MGWGEGSAGEMLHPELLLPALSLFLGSPHPCLPVLSRWAPPPTKTGTPTKGFEKAARAHLKISSTFGKDPWVTLEHRDASFDTALHPPSLQPTTRDHHGTWALHPPVASASYCWLPLQGV